MPRKRLLTRRKLVKNQKLLTVLIVTFCEGNGLAEVEENDSNDTPVSEDDAQSCSVHTRLLLQKHISLNDINENDSKDKKKNGS